MREYVIWATKHFFELGHLLKEVNHIILTIVPKASNLSTCHDLRLIACYNTIYKCISKIMANRLKGVLSYFINKV